MGTPAEAAKRPRLNSRQTGQKIPAIATQNRFEPLHDQIPLRSDPPPQNNADNVLPKSTASSNSARNKPTAVLIGDSGQTNP